ncbi:MAG: Gfo/Idh/MocA family oxidoreductase [Chloroflexi bacterium]|nr:Gfo/Idh/MocA family oxidoreductase [Chloroflexota bacterium]
MPLTDKLRVAVVGAGILGSRHARVFAEQPDCELVAVADLNIARAEQVAQAHGARPFTDFEVMLRSVDVDAVAVATPDHLHRAPVVAALQAGKHVFMEKPLATTAQDAREIVAEAASAYVVAMVNYSQRFVSDHVWIKQALETGELGKPAFILSVKFDTRSVPTGMIASWAAQTSPLYFMSSHDLDLVHWFLGADPIEVFAQEVRGTLDAQGINVHDGLNALIQFKGGVSANFHSSWIHPNTYPRVSDGYLQIIGSEGALTYHARTRTAELYTARGGQEVKFNGPHTADIVDGKITGAFTASLRHFVECIREGCEPDTSPRRVLPTAEAQAAAIQSLGSQQPVRLT